VQDLGVEVQQLGQGRVVSLVPGLVLLMVMVVVMAFQGSTLRPACAAGIESCV
jgi:hypothetical protein